MNPYIEIMGRRIGFDYAPLVIAEIGINHNGSLEEAKKLVRAAKEAGAEIVKHHYREAFFKTLQKVFTDDFFDVKVQKTFSKFEKE